MLPRPFRGRLAFVSLKVLNVALGGGEGSTWLVNFQVHGLVLEVVKARRSGRFKPVNRTNLPKGLGEPRLRNSNLLIGPRRAVQVHTLLTIL